MVLSRHAEQEQHKLYAIIHARVAAQSSLNTELTCWLGALAHSISDQLLELQTTPIPAPSSLKRPSKLTQFFLRIFPYISMELRGHQTKCDSTSALPLYKTIHHREDVQVTKLYIIVKTCRSVSLVQKPQGIQIALESESDMLNKKNVLLTRYRGKLTFISPQFILHPISIGCAMARTTQSR